MEDRYHSEDITFCNSQCERTACFRHPSNIRDKDREHTFSPLKGTAYCEIVHAFFLESGLHESSGSADAWASNEAMVDWFARQGQKIYEAWNEAGALDAHKNRSKENT